MGKRKVKGQTIFNTEVEEYLEPVKTKTVFQRDRREGFSSLAEEIAGDKLYYRGHYYPGGKEIFPGSIRLHTVDKYFPYAEGGPLFIDEVDRTEDVTIFKEKTEKMKALGHRYVAILPGMTKLDIIERIA